MIKRLITAAAITMTSLGGLSTPAQAGVEISIGFGQTYVSGRASCGCPIHTRKVCRGFDHYHRPIFSYHRLPFRCSCRHAKHPPGHAHGHYKKAKPPKHCKPPKHYYKHRGKHHHKHSGKKGKKH